MAASEVKSLEPKTLEEICKVLLLLRRELIRVYEACQEKRQETDCRVAQCRALLKPWPSSAVKQENVHSGTHLSATKTEGEEAPALEAEQQDLVMLEKLLKKAQKVDEAKEKVTSTIKKMPASKPKANPGIKEPSKRVFPSKTTVRQPVLDRKPQSKQSSMKTTYSSSYGTKSRPSSSRSSSQKTKNTEDRLRDTMQSSQSTSDHGGSREKSGRRAVSVAETSSNERKDEHQLGQSTSGSSGEARKPVKGVEQGMAPINENLSDLGGVTGQKNSTAEGERPFNLLSDGCSLKLPSKYRKIKKQSAKLDSQLRNARRSQSASHARFVECLELTFDFKTTTTHARLHEEASQLVTWHERLLRLASAAVTESRGLVTGASTSWQQVYKAYRLWQLALNRFDELQRRTQQLLQDEETLRKSCPCGNCAEAERYSMQSGPSVEPGEKPGTQGKGGCVLLSDWLPRQEQTLDDRSTRELTYSSCKDITELLRLHHTAQLLRHQLTFGRLATDKLLPLVNKLDTTDRTFVPQFFRVLFSLLCLEGKMFPAMVLDTFPG